MTKLFVSLREVINSDLPTFDHEALLEGGVRAIGRRWRHQVEQEVQKGRMTLLVGEDPMPVNPECHVNADADKTK